MGAHFIGELPLDPASLGGDIGKLVSVAGGVCVNEQRGNRKTTIVLRI